MSLKKAALKLQGELANVDFWTRPSTGLPEFLVVQSQALQVKIKMYEEDGPTRWAPRANRPASTAAPVAVTN